MKLTFKDLKQQKFLIEAEPSDTIASLKEKISAEKGWEVAQQKLIYSGKSPLALGKILQDQNTIQSYSIEEKGFIVCMISKPKVTPQPAATEASSSSVSTPKNAAPSTPAHQNAPASTPSAPIAAAPQNVPETPSPAGPGVVVSVPEAATSPAFNDPSALTMGAQREAAIQNMLEMGYERENIDRAMRAAFYNPDRAVEYLLMGIPEHLQQEHRTRQPAAQPQPAENPASPPPGAAAQAQAQAAPVAAPAEGENVNLFEAAANAARQRQQSGGGGAGAGLGNLEFLRSNPQFQQLRQVVHQLPHMLEPILQQVSQGNPGLAALINQNQEAFLQLLGENSEDDDAALPPGTHQVVVTEDERQAIERLCRLGFERDLVIQAYFAFDKNEELAANFLFEQPDADED